MVKIRRLPEGQPSPPAEITDMAWLAGRWQGEVFGGQAEEIWSPPWGKTMVGTYRHLVDGALNFYEFMVIEAVEGSLVLRLKHFDPGLEGWEEKDEVISFPLVVLEDRLAFFDGITFFRREEELLEVHLRMVRGGKEQEEIFRYRRVG